MVSNKRNPGDFLKTERKKGINTLAGGWQADVASFVTSERSRYELARREVELTWLECWSLYMGTPRAVDYQRSQVHKTVGDVNTNWRHRINTGKAYEAVETIHGYLMSATFPNRDFFDMQPVLPNYAALARVVKKYMTTKMYEGKFYSAYADYIRQLIITGNSCMALPWRYESTPFKRNVKVKTPSGFDTNGMPLGESWRWEVREEEKVIVNSPDFEVLDVFDCYLEPNVKNGEGNFIRRMVKTRSEVSRLMDAGVYSSEHSSVADIMNVTAYSTAQQNERTLSSFSGINTAGEHDMDDEVELVEFWGDIVVGDGTTYHDVQVTLCGDCLLVFRPNPYWGGRPFVWGTYTDIMQAYGMGAIEPNAGVLHELNIITNLRLDNQELSINSMWSVKQDGIVQPEDISTEPGKVYSVMEHNDIQPLPAGSTEWRITYQEVSVLETIIDKNFATGNLVSAGAARSGERVTATEIQAVRDAGGNRLTNIHRHIENTSLYPLLMGVFNQMRQFVKEPEVMRLSGMKPGDYEYYELDPSVAFMHDYKLMPVGADYVTDQGKYLQQRLQFIQAVSQVPQMAEKLNWEKLLYDITNHMGFEDPDSYIIEPQKPPMPVEGQESEQQLLPTAAEPDPSSPEGLAAADSAALEELQSIGGKPLGAAYQAMKASGMSEQMLQQAASNQPVPPPIQE